MPTLTTVTRRHADGRRWVAGANLTGGTIQPSSIFTVNGNLTLGAGATLTTVINGTDPATQFGQVRVFGTVTLGGTLNATLGAGFTPVEGNSFVIIDNDGADAVSGTFAGLAQGARVNLGGLNLSITYTGGDGNDVVLEAPVGAPLFTTYLAEGATNAFFDVRIALVNPSATETANGTMRFLKSTGGHSHITTLTIPAMGRITINPELDVPDLADANFSTVVETNVRVVVDRTMSWDASGYGSHAETSSSAPATTWYFAEGATHGQFDLFYLLQNATRRRPTVEITYLLPAGRRADRAVRTVGANSRMTIQVDQVPGLDGDRRVGDHPRHQRRADLDRAGDVRVDAGAAVRGRHRRGRASRRRPPPGSSPKARPDRSSTSSCCSPTRIRPMPR